jgi:LDH2 family malate/lactate/ureidoglycolate dehydrogenase
MALEYEGYLMKSEGARRICEEVFKKVGMSPECAARVADCLLFADLRGVNTHGVSRVKSYVRCAQSGHYNAKAKPRVVRDLGGSIVIDADSAYGAYVGAMAMQMAIERAKTTGVALCAVNHSTHCGSLAYYTMMALEHNMIGFASTNSLPNVAPYGSRKAMMGTNPLCIAVPAKNRRPFVLDMATSVVARGNVINCAREGREIPLGWAIDIDGKPTTDPNRALAGASLPFGSYKGSGIAIALDILCGVLSGAGFGESVLSPETAEARGGANPNFGQVFCAVNIAFYQDVDAFKANMDEMIDGIKNCPKADGIEEIFIPGEPEFNKEEKIRKTGIPVAKGTFRELCEICRELDIPLNPEDYLL